MFGVKVPPAMTSGMGGGVHGGGAGGAGGGGCGAGSTISEAGSSGSAGGHGRRCVSVNDIRRAFEKAEQSLAISASAQCVTF